MEKGQLGKKQYSLRHLNEEGTEDAKTKDVAGKTIEYSIGVPPRELPESIMEGDTINYGMD